LFFVECEIHNASPDFFAISVSIVSRGRREEKARSKYEIPEGIEILNKFQAIKTKFQTKRKREWWRSGLKPDPTD
jgi:hypothetical protein